MALKDITTIEETEQLSADATFYTEDGGAFRRAGVDAVKDALGLALESTATKEALLNCFRHVAWVDENGQEYYDALYDALYNIPVSITATFLQGSNTIYNTDPLSTLRQYLVVRATYEDETVQTVTAYTLSGRLTVGTSTITVVYKGRSATFEVTVTQAESYITAVYTPGTEPVYVDEGLDVLKDRLVVTYYARQGATGVVVPAADYTLSGTLTAGTSTILVDYNGNTTAFSVSGVIDFYNTWEWNWNTSDSGGLTWVNGSPGIGDNLSPNRIIINQNATMSANRRAIVTSRGISPFYGLQSHEALEYYPIPVPASANHVTMTISPNSKYLICDIVRFIED
jgi:hypothetical protein